MASAAVQNKTPRKVLKKSTRDSLIAYSFIAPNFIGFCVFTLVPMVFAIALAFCAWDGRHAIEFVGLKNFVKLFTTDKIFQAALKNTIVYVIGTVPLTLACSLAMAVLLNQNVKLRNFFRTVAFFPYVASLVAVAAVWNMIFNPSMGPINMILNQFFGVAVENLPRWAAGKDTAMITVILFSVWKNMGYYMVIYLGRPAGLQPGPERSRRAGRCKPLAAVLAHHSAPAAAYHLLCGHHAHHLRLQGLRPDVHDHAGRPRYCYHDAGVLHL